MSGKMLNRRAWGEGWVHWAVIAHSTGNSCLVLEAGQKTCCGLGLDFCFACVFFALPCTYSARVSLTSGSARGSSFPCHLFAPRQALSQMTDFKQGCPEVKAALVLACIQGSQWRVPLSALRCQFIKGSHCSGCVRDNECVCAFQSVAREGKFRRCSLAIFLVQPAFLLPATIHPESLLQHKRLFVVKCISVDPKGQFHNKGSSCTSDSA